MEDLLKTNRDQLEKINQKLFEILAQRQDIVSKIQTLKKSPYDIQREFELFSSMKNLSEQSLEEAFIFSMIIENQAQTKTCSYPKWSLKGHINEVNGQIEEQINPLILALYHKKSYDSLNLNEQIKDSIEKICKIVKIK